MIQITDLEIIAEGRYYIPDCGVAIQFIRSSDHTPKYQIQPLSSLGYKRIMEEGSKIPFGEEYPSLQSALDAYNKSITPVLDADTDIIDKHKIE